VVCRRSTSPYGTCPFLGVEASPAPILVLRNLDDRALRRPDGFAPGTPELVPIDPGGRSGVPQHAKSGAADALDVGEPSILSQRRTVYLYSRTGWQGIGGQRVAALGGRCPTQDHSSHTGCSTYAHPTGPGVTAFAGRFGKVPVPGREPVRILHDKRAREAVSARWRS